MSKLIPAILLCATAVGTASAQQPATGYGRNLLTVSPVQVSEMTLTGVGIQYEHFIGSSNKFSLYLPLAYSFGKSDPCNDLVRTHMLYAYPGFKFYPAGSQHKVTYAVGPSIAVGKGNTNCACVNGGEEVGLEIVTAKEYKPITEIGMLINNSINIQASQHIYLGGEVGVGSSFVNIENGKDFGRDLMLQMNVKVGYRFK